MQLKPEALNALKLPIKVKAGFLGSVRLKVRSSSIKTGFTAWSYTHGGKDRNCIRMDIPLAIWLIVWKVWNRRVFGGLETSVHSKCYSWLRLCFLHSNIDFHSFLDLIDDVS
eukprot:TRINITY_DN15438_c0_g1_i3.p1 TRINITY_DN15438_c0_g1~~TRINITY_DN15438_c0_g1_i3.p1  ORF type:complete len:112 (+),score=15.37 TRINITY_DN15438_c0_g1_i3:451-786(+)